MDANAMSRYDWLRAEIGLIPRRKFHVFESRSLAELKTVEDCYGQLPLDYREFVETFGHAKLFRNNRNPWYNLSVVAPPKVKVLEGNLVCIKLGHYVNTGDAWLEWSGASFVKGTAVFSGFSRQRRKVVTCFEEWLKRSFAAARKLYSKKEWTVLTKPAPPFTASEQRIVDAIPQYLFRKIDVTPGGNVLVEIENKSAVELSHLTIGVRIVDGMSGAVALPTVGIAPGTTKTIEADLYRESMNPQLVELFRLPLPDPEDRPYFWEFRDTIS